MKKTRILTIVTALCMLVAMLGVFTLSANAAEVASGITGDVSWTLTDDGTLTFSGEGAMEGKNSYESYPWYKYRNDVKRIVIENGVTEIAQFAFNYFSALESVSIGNTIVRFGVEVFSGCSNLTSVEYWGTTEIPGNQYTFSGCTKLSEVKVPVNFTGEAFHGVQVNKILCDHAGHTQTGCIACGATDGSIHSFVSGTCSVCGLVCAHDGTYDSATGKCGTCDKLIAEASVSLNGGAEVFYMSLESALIATKTKNENDKSFVKVYNDVNRDLYVILNRTVTLDLNGHTVKSTDDLPQVGRDTTPRVYGELTIIDSGTGGKLIATGFGNGIVVDGGSKLTVLSGSIIVSNFSPIEARDDTQIIIGGTAEIISKTLYGVDLNGDNITMSVTGGSITGGQYSISIADYTQLKSLTISGGTIKGAYKEWTSAGSKIKPVITGGSFPEGIEIDGGNAYLTLLLGDGYVYYVDGVPTAVEAGVRSLEGNVTVKPCDHSGEFDTATGNCAVCGEYTAVASLTTADATPVVTYYATFEEVFAAAQEINGCTVTILCDGELLNVVPIKNGSFIVDLNGKTITDLFKLSGGSVTVKGNGTVKEELGVYYSQSTLIIEGGAYEMVTAVSGNLTVRGGTFGRINLSKNYHDSLAKILPKDYYLYDENGKIINAGAVVGNNVYYCVDNVTVKKGADLSKDAVITVSNSEYNGAAQTPTVVVTVGGVTLEYGVDYTVTVDGGAEARDVGEYPITVTGIGSYTGSVGNTFTIEKAMPSINIDASYLNKTYNLQKHTVTVDLPAEIDEQYVTVSYWKGDNRLPEAPIDVGTYEVHVNIKGSPNYEDRYMIFDMIISPAAVTVEIMEINPEFFYTGGAHTPAVIVTLNGGLPFDPTEYGGTVDYTNNTEVGTATATVSGNFTGYCTFEIKKATPTITVSAPLDKVMPGYVMDITGATNAIDNFLYPTTFTVVDGEGYSVSGNTITIDEGVVIGSTITVKMTSTETKNFLASEGTLTLTIGVPTVDTVEIEKDIADLEELVAGLQEQINANDGDIAGILADLTAKYNELKGLNDTLNALIGTLPDGVESMKAYVDSIDAALKAADLSINQALAILEEKLDEEASERESKDNELESSIDELESDLNEEASERESKDNELESSIDELESDLNEEASERESKDNELESSIDELESDLNEEASERESKDNELESSIDELESDLKEEESARIEKDGEIVATLDSAKSELAQAIADGDSALGSRISLLKHNLNQAKAALEQADAENKAELIAKIEESEKVLDEAIKAVQKNLDDTRAELEKAIADGDKALDDKVSALNEALEAAKAALEEADSKNKAALEAKITSAQQTLQAAIDKLSADLKDAQQAIDKVGADLAAAEAALAQAIDKTDADLAAAEAALDAKDGELNTMAIIAIVVGGVGVCGNIALLTWIVVDKRKKRV